MRKNDFHHPFFIPLWRRVAIVAVCLAWGVFELVMGNTIWGLLFGGIGGLAAWHFFVTWGDGPTPDA